MKANREMDDMREICIEAWNMLFGRAIFAYFFLPSSWITGYQMNDPLVTNRFLYKNHVWVGSGDIECLISREHGVKKRPDLDFKIKIIVDLQKKGVVAPTPEELFDRHTKKGQLVIEHGTLHSGDHNGSYVLWSITRPRFRFFGEPCLTAQLHGYIPCTDTSRLIRVTWTSPSSELILENSDILISSLNSILCHGHDVEDTEDGFL